ncbi:hypothetical protein AWE51_00185 [Aquimarina aggregata]|uniref:Uncharacterized protein n=1 Tax=Aquimarina aggregata TaxID=1642818 RepID=A0A162CW04_9FLAO|nr:hypothetical protein [Aquimarina aggregata]KZS41899.1 hypothetical protein AWE51_00185 [Aquimarina aggregata]
MTQPQPHNTYFKVVGIPHVYINPRLGRIDLTKPFTDEQALLWYKDINFPYIKPIPGAEELLSKEKVETIIKLIHKANSPEEISILKAAKPDSKKIKEL